MGFVMGDKMDASTREYVDARIKENLAAGDKPKFAVAKAYDSARQIGFDVPEQKKRFSFFGLFKGKQHNKMGKVS